MGQQRRKVLSDVCVCEETPEEQLRRNSSRNSSSPSVLSAWGVAGIKIQEWVPNTDVLQYKDLHPSV